MKVPARSRTADDPLEAFIEKKVCAYAEKLGVMTRKYTSPNHRSVPDRILFWGNGVVSFIEFKRKHGKLTTGQEREIAKLRAKGMAVVVIHSVEQGITYLDFEKMILI